MFWQKIRVRKANRKRQKRKMDRWTDRKNDKESRRGKMEVTLMTM